MFHPASTSDTIDWKEDRSAKTILDTVIPKLHPGCIILCHNNGYKIKEYLPTLIKTAQEQGYEFVTVLTKCDKLNKTQRSEMLMNICEELTKHGCTRVIPFSALKGDGTQDIRKVIEDAVG